MELTDFQKKLIKDSGATLNDKTGKPNVSFKGATPIELSDSYLQNNLGYTQQTFFVGDTGLGDSKYDYNIPLNKVLEGDLEKIRASRQGIGAKLFNSLVGGATSGAVGILENFSNMGDVALQKIGVLEDFERSFVSQGLKDAKEYINELTPLYRKDRNKTFDWTDSGWYFEMLKGTIDSAVSFGFAGMGYAGLVSKLGSTLGKVSLAGKRLDVMTRAIGGAGAAPGLTQLSGAVLSNYAEGTVMALETYDQTKEKLFDLYVKDRAKQLSVEQGIPESMVEIPQEELEKFEIDSIKEAGKAGHMMRDLNHFLLLGNLYQMKAIGGIWGAIKGGGQGGSRNLITKPYKKGVITDAKFWKDQAIGAPLEASEEILQNVIQMESQYQSEQNAMSAGLNISEADKISNTANMGERLLEFATSPQALLEGLMGAISGPIQYGITQAPFRRAQQAEQAKRYLTQQSIIGKNTDFVKNKLKLANDTNTLATQFEQFSTEILGRDDKAYEGEEGQKLKTQDQEKFSELIALTPFDALVQENLFNGTTEVLESELQSVLNDTEADNESKQMANKHLERLASLEQRFNSYNKYINGAEIFAAQLTGERLTEIDKILEEGFSNREAEMTKDIQAQIEQSLKMMLGDSFSGQLTELNNYFELNGTKKVDKKDASGNVILDKNGNPEKETVNNPEVKKEVNSVSDIVKGIREGYKIVAKETNDTKQSTINNIVRAMTNIESVSTSLQNRALQETIKDAISENRVLVNESKTIEYQSLYADYVDAKESVDENDVHEINTVKVSLNNLLKDERFDIKDNKPSRNIQLYNKIKLDIDRLEKQEQQIIEEENALGEKEKEELINKNKTETRNNKTRTPETTGQAVNVNNNPVNNENKNNIDVQSNNPVVNNVNNENPIETQVDDEIISDNTKVSPKPLFTEEQNKSISKLKNKEPSKRGVQFVNPKTGFSETFADIRVKPGEPQISEISFVSNPDEYFEFENLMTGVRSISTLKEQKLENATEFVPVSGMKVTYKGQPGYTIANVSDKTIKLRKDGTNQAPKSITIDEAFVDLAPVDNNPVTKPSDTSNTIPKDNNTIPSNQINHQKSNKVRNNKIRTSENVQNTNESDTELNTKTVDTKVEIPDIEAIPADTTSISNSNTKPFIEIDEQLEGTQRQIDVIQFQDENGNVIIESANVKAFDYIQGPTVSNSYNDFLNNGKNKEGIEIELYPSTLTNPENLYPTTRKNVKKAVDIFNKIKGKTKDFNEAVAMLTEDEVDIMMNFLPIQFNVKSKRGINAHLHVKSNSQAQKRAEYNIRKDAIDAALQGKKLSRLIKGQGPGRLNTLEQAVPVIESLGNKDINGEHFHIIIDGNLTPLTTKGPKFENTVMTYTDAQGNTYPWNGVFTISVNTMSGQAVPVKLNTRRHDEGSAEVVASLLKNMVDDKFKGVSDNNVRNMSLEAVNPVAYEWIKQNIPSMIETYSNKITLGQALEDMLYYGPKTKNSFGYIDVQNGQVKFGGNGETNLTTMNAAALNNEANVKKLVDYIISTKGFNVNANKIKNDNKYKKHVLSSYLLTDVNLQQPVIRDVQSNPEGDRVKRYSNGHLYISSLPDPKQGQTKTVTENKTKPQTTPEAIATEVEKISEKNTNLAPEKTNTQTTVKSGVKQRITKPKVVENKEQKEMKEKIEKEIDNCPTGIKTPTNKQAGKSIASGLKGFKRK